MPPASLNFQCPLVDALLKAFLAHTGAVLGVTLSACGQKTNKVLNYSHLDWDWTISVRSIVSHNHKWRALVSCWKCTSGAVFVVVQEWAKYCSGASAVTCLHCQLDLSRRCNIFGFASGAFFSGRWALNMRIPVCTSLHKKSFVRRPRGPQTRCSSPEFLRHYSFVEVLLYWPLF